MSKNDNERWKNFIIFGYPGTDKELDETAPFVLKVISIIIVIGFLAWAGYQTYCNSLYL